MSDQETKPLSEDRYIHRMVDAASDGGEVDYYAGKRRWLRFKAGMRLEITTDLDRIEAAWPALMHNVSTGGVAFWSKQELQERESIFVREFGEEGADAWVPAHVQHCTIGIRGFLIGAEFEPTSPPGLP